MKLPLTLVSAPVPLRERYGFFAGVASTEPSFGLVCLAAVARQAGHPAAIVEASAGDLSPPKALAAVLRTEPRVVGFSATTSGVIAAADLAAQVKRARPEIVTLIGGCHVTALPAETLRAFPAFDLAVVGEGEETLAEVLAALSADPGRIPGAIAGTAVRQGEEVILNPARPLIADLDRLPLPAWDLLPGFPRAFKPSPLRIRRWPCASIVLTRGCPNQCVFCDRSVFGNRCRGYSPEYAVRLALDLRDRFGVREILIEDDTFVIVRDRVREFCERLIAARAGLSWSCLGRADRVTPELLALMRRAGCWHISYGIESGDPAILQAMHKRLNLDQIRQAVRWSRAAGLRTKGFFIVGFPGETQASLRLTRELALALPLDDISVMQMTPFPGSELFRIAEHYGAFDRDWRRMNAVEAVFVPTGFTAADLDAARVRLARAFYLRPGVAIRQALHILRHPRVMLQILRGGRVILNLLWPRRRRSAHG